MNDYYARALIESMRRIDRTLEKIEKLLEIRCNHTTEESDEGEEDQKEMDI